MDLSQQGLKTNGKLFFQISNSFSNYWPKTEKHSKSRCEYYQSAICYISMDLSRQALQTN